MTPAEAGALLTCAAAFDNRKPDPDAATAWSLALDGLRFVDCRDVIVAHYRRTTDWLMPAHVIEGVNRLRRERLDAAGPLTPPPELDPDDTEGYARWIRTEQTSIADGNPPTSATPLPSREMPDLKSLMPSVPAVTTAAPSKGPEWQRHKEAARAELDGLRERLAAEAPEPERPDPAQEPKAAESAAAEVEVSHG